MALTTYSCEYAAQPHLGNDKSLLLNAHIFLQTVPGLETKACEITVLLLNAGMNCNVSSPQSFANPLWNATRPAPRTPPRRRRRRRRFHTRLTLLFNRNEQYLMKMLVPVVQ